MKLTIKIEEQDFLDFHNFTASKSDRIQKKKRNGWILMTIIGSIFTFLFYFENQFPLFIYCLAFTLITLIFYPKYFVWRYKKHYKKYVNENYNARFGTDCLIEMGDESIQYKDKTGEGKFYITEIEKVDETRDQFFIKISNGHTLILPKREIEKSEDVKNTFLEKGLTINNEQNWKFQ